MSLYRDIVLSMMESKGTARWYHYIYHRLLDTVEYRPTWWIRARHFLRVLPIFVRLARNWRPWDYQYTIEVLCELLKEQAKYMGEKDTFIGSKKAARRAYTAAGLLDRAYSESMDPTMSYVINIMYKRGFNHSDKYLKNKDLYDRLYQTANKRCKEEEARAKREAWEYLNKYIEHFWD